MPLGVSVRPKAQQGINPMDQKKIERINELARKSKAEGLTDAEKHEQQALREEYIASFRASLVGQLENTTILYPDGSKKKVTRKPQQKPKS